MAFGSLIKATFLDRGLTFAERIAPNGGVTLRVTCAPIATVIATLTRTVGVPVTDRTELAGTWDYELSFSGERRGRSTAAAVAAEPSDPPVLFTALQEQLGLKLESTRGAVEVFVIDSVELPTPD